MKFDKNTIIGFLLIMLLLLYYSQYMAKSKKATQTVTNTVTKTVTQAQTQPDASTAQQPSSAQQSNAGALTSIPDATREPHFNTLTNSLVAFTFSDIGGSIYSVELAKNSVVRKGPLRTSFAPSNEWQTPLRIRQFAHLDVENIPVGVASITDNSLTYTGTVKSLIKLTKTYSLTPETYLLDAEYTFENIADSSIILSNSFSVWLGQMDQVTRTRDRYARRGADVEVITEKGGYDIIRENAGKSDEWQTIPGKGVWLAVRNKYFTHVMIPEMNTAAVKVRSIGHKDARDITAYAQFTAPTIATNQSYTWKATLYTGPKSIERLKTLPSKIGRGTKYDEIIDLGWFSFLARPILVYGLKGLYNFTHNFGLSIIILTILIKLITWPLTTKSVMSMKQMQKMQPEMQALKEKYKDDPKKQQAEMMLLYKKHGANPLSGCLPMFLQLPIFISLYAALSGAIELWGTSFLWIHDLSMPDTVAHIPYVIPFLGDKALGYTGLNILPLMMCGAMIGQQALSPSAGDPSQKKMMYFMPVIFLFIFYKMPSGLTLYWFVNQLLTMGQMFYLHYIKK